jgi:hypothetical protein
MYKVTVQIKKPSLQWDDIEKIEHTFNNWVEVSTFAYRLALQMDKEVRVQYNGNGNYYQASNANNFLNNLKTEK